MKQIQNFFKRNTATILTCVGSIGVIATSVVAVRSTPKALSLLSEEEKNKKDKLTFIDKIKIIGPVYLPSILIGLSTIGCIFGANVFNKRAQASLASSFSLLGNMYNEYRNNVDNVFGEGSDEKVISEIAKNKYENYINNDPNDELFFDSFSLRYFKSTMIKVKDAENYLQHVLQKDGSVAISDFYEHLGICCYSSDYNIGWGESDEGFYTINDYVQFKYIKNITEDGTPYWLISACEK